MLNNLPLKWKGVLILVVAMLGLLVQSYSSVITLRQSVMGEKRIKLKELVNSATDIAQRNAELAEQGYMTVAEAQEKTKDTIRSMRYSEKNDYFFVFEYDGTALVMGSPASEGKNLIDLKDPNGLKFIVELINNAKNGGDFLDYVWKRDGQPVPKLSYSDAFTKWNWMIGTGVYIDDVEEQVFTQIKKTAIAVFIILLAVGSVVFYILSSIIKPVLKTSEQMEMIANQKSVEIAGVDRKDELGQMARTLLNLKDSVERQRQLEIELAKKEAQKAEEQKKMMNDIADNFQEQVGSVAQAIDDAAQDMQQMSVALAAASEETSQYSTSVASATEEASTNVQTVASAAEELSASIQELVRNMAETTTATKACSDAALVSQDYLKTLQTSVDEIDGVIQAINDVATQTNLLALNATIEAARAGDAGKGFAVVANEVKSLASETNNMTEEIAKKIDDIKNSARDTIASVQDIVEQISAVSGRTTSISAAIEEQNSSTKEISRSAQEAATGTNEVSASIVQVQQAANDTAESTESVKGASDGLAEQAVTLKDSISKFIAEIRAG